MGAHHDAIAVVTKGEVGAMSSKTIATPTRSTVDVPVRRERRLGARLRKTTLALHILSGGIWIGVDVIVAVLVFTGWFSDDPAVKGVAYRALSLFVVWPMLAAGLVCLATGVVLGWGSKWGLLRYWWVAVKLVLNLVLCTLIVVVLRPGMGDVGEHGSDLLAGETSTRDMSTLFFPPAVSLIALSFATVLGVFKPWGRIGSRRRRSRLTRP